MLFLETLFGERSLGEACQDLQIREFRFYALSGWRPRWRSWSPGRPAVLPCPRLPSPLSATGRKVVRQRVVGACQVVRCQKVLVVHVTRHLRLVERMACRWRLGELLPPRQNYEIVRNCFCGYKQIRCPSLATARDDLPGAVALAVRRQINRLANAKNRRSNQVRQRDGQQIS